MRDSNPPGNIRGGQADRLLTKEPAHHIIHNIIQAIRASSKELMPILEAGYTTTVYLWSGAFSDVLGTAENMSLELLRDRFHRYLYSDNLADVAKLMLCLALHLQQLPTRLDTLPNSPAAALDRLSEYCMSSAEILLASDDCLGEPLSMLECMMLQSELYINVGNLRRVWLVVRRAINLAQLLGLHRNIGADVDPRLVMRRNTIWTELWQKERGFSLILGLPYSALDSQIPRLSLDDDTSELQRTRLFLQELGVVMGHIIDRDEGLNSTTYSTTLKIEEQLEECQRIMSVPWWSLTPGPATPAEAISGMFTAKMRFYTVQRLLHLPFLLKASDDRKYDGSRLSALKSSREIINVYNVLRNRPVLKVCNMADFQVFAAAMTLVIDLLAYSRTPDSCDLHQKERDWQLVSQTARELERVSQSMRGCDVAVLGARVLQDFSNLRSGPAEGI